MRMLLDAIRPAASAVSCLVGTAALAAALVPGPSRAQERVGYYDYMRHELTWYTIETEHFLIHFHADSTGKGADRTAQVVARVAEDIYEPITSLYRHEPDSKVSIVLKDYEDYSNGAAYFFENKIEIWAPSLATPLRGESSWLRNVITHEFTHIVQVQKAMKGSRKWPFYYIQWLAYEDVRRPDVLYGYPDVIVSYPAPVLNNPAWFAEGTAQYQRSDLQYDRWDTHRDMLLRSRFLGGKELNLDAMGDLYSKTSLEREQVYNQGFAFTTHLANEYGEESLRKISDHLGDLFNWSIESAISDALGEDGDEIFESWVKRVRAAYLNATSEIRDAEFAGEIVEPNGAFNFSPRFSPDGSMIAYTSSRGGDFSRTNLYVVHTDSGIASVTKLDGLHFEHATGSHPCALKGALASNVTGSIDWSPDGKKIIYARTRDTDRGYLYADLYEVELASEESRRITTNARATSPSYSPDGRKIVFVRQSDGSTNLFAVDTTRGSSPVALTRFNDGTQVYTPRWHPDGSSIYFATGPADGGRDIYSVNTDGSNLRPAVETSHDERDPAVSHDGRWLYFASDQTGIFNLNRVELNGAGLPSSSPAQLTNVVGGAFGPDVSRDGSVAYSLFGSDGYQIALLENPQPVEPTYYDVPEILRKKPGSPMPSGDLLALNEYDDTDLRGWSDYERFVPEAEIGSEEAQSTTSITEASEYSDTFSSFQFFPVLRFDMYANSDRAGLDRPGERPFQGGELLRNTKLGLYMASREVLDGLSLTAGLQFGLWSKPWDSFGDFISPGRLDKVERDVFFRFDYRKSVPFFKKRWAPQLSLEFYNVVRNVENGLALEEFPCTACYPDTTFANISYSLWEVDVFARSKLNRGMLLEIGYRYSPYRARTETFFSEEEGVSIPASSTRYFIGHALGAKLYMESLRPHRNDDILPLGMRAELGYEYQPGQLLDDFTIEDGLLVPEYLSTKKHHLLADLRLAWRLPFGSSTAPHGLGVRVRGTTILGDEVDSFYNDYVGGLTRARGYPFYALGGNETLWAQVAYQFPIVPRIGKQLLFLHLNKLYGRVYGDAAAAWTNEFPGGDEIRTDLGAELRLGISSFYLLPTAAFLSATYGFDEFEVRLDDGFVTPDGRQSVRYGRQLLWHFGVLFEFDL